MPLVHPRAVFRSLSRRVRSFALGALGVWLTACYVLFHAAFSLHRVKLDPARLLMIYNYLYLYIWLVVWNMCCLRYLRQRVVQSGTKWWFGTFFFPYIGNNNPN